MGPEKQQIGFIGAGNMAEAMVGAMIDTQLFAPVDIMASDIDPKRLAYLKETYGIRTAPGNAEIVNFASIVVFAVKPQQIRTVLDDLCRAGAFENQANRKCFVSIAAGIRMETFERFIYSTPGEPAPILRVMPNTPALVGAGMCALCGNAHARPDDIDNLKAILSTMGNVLVCGEDKMDAITALSGSGPAYCFYMIESMVAAGEKLGLSSAQATELTVTTFSGALKLMDARNETAESLRRKVTSPGGTTEAALRTLDARGWPAAIIEAVAAAAERSRQLSDLE